jgi:hypothetical protein
VVNTLTERAATRGLTVKNERFALLDGTLYGEGGVQTRVPGARLFGSLDFAPVPGMPFPAGCAPSAWWPRRICACASRWTMSAPT